jgi:hypothetical protein
VLQIVGGDPDMVEEKKRTMAFKDIENLAFSFKSIARIDNLKVGPNRPCAAMCFRSSKTTLH